MNKVLIKKIKKNDDIENVLNNDGLMNKINETKNLIGEIIGERKRNSVIKLSQHNNRNKHNNNEIQNIKSQSMPKITNKTLGASKNNHKYKLKSNTIDININNNLKKISPYIISVSFKSVQTIDDNKSEYISKKNNKVSFGQSLNETLINNINEAIMKKGSIIQEIKRKNYSSIVYRSGYSKTNDHDLHKKIFDLKLVEIYEDFQKQQSLYRKQRIEKLMPSLEERRQKLKNKMPLLIKGYNKKNLDIIYTRNICDLDYQRYYNKNQLNLNEILENHNKYNRKDYLSGNIPFFLLTKSVFKPMFRKSGSQENLNNKYKRNIKI